MNSLLLTGGRVIDPANRLDAVADLLIINGKIAGIGSDIARQAASESEKLNVSGLVVCPRLIDLHGPDGQGNHSHRNGGGRAGRLFFNRLHAEHITRD